jgi:hypothetical protein
MSIRAERFGAPARVRRSGFGVQSPVGVQSLGFRVWGSEFRVQVRGSEFRVPSSEFGFRVQALACLRCQVNPEGDAGVGPRVSPRTRGANRRGDINRRGDSFGKTPRQSPATKAGSIPTSALMAPATRYSWISTEKPSSTLPRLPLPTVTCR